MTFTFYAFIWVPRKLSAGLFGKSTVLQNATFKQISMKFVLFDKRPGMVQMQWLHVTLEHTVIYDLKNVSHFSIGG